MKYRVVGSLVALCLFLCAFGTRAQSIREYENRVTVMLELAVRLEDRARRHLGDKGLVSYVHAISDANVTEAARLAPPPNYAVLHPHFVIVLENLERAMFFASKGDLSRYRKHIKTMRKEIVLLESLAAKAGLVLYAWESVH